MIGNEHFSATFDERSGTLAVRRADGRAFVTSAAACANTDLGKISTASAERQHSVEISRHRDHLGSGQRLAIASRDLERRLDLRLDVVIYDARSTLTVELQCVNASARQMTIASLEPLRAVASEGGALHVPGVGTCLTNGEMYYDAGRVVTLSAEPPAGCRPPIKGARVVNATVARDRPTIASWWNVGLFGGYEREGVVVGYLESSLALGVLLLARTAEGELALVSESVYSPPLTLPPGRSLSSSRLMIHVDKSPYAALEQYADAVGAVQNARTGSLVNGWCSWFYTLAEVSEEEVLRNTAFAARRLRPFGLEHIQIDEGYQRSHGDWEGNERFPSGMKALADRIKEYGFKPGLWISPYVIAENTEVFQNHPDWLVRRRDGSLQRIGNWEGEDSPGALAEVVKRYCLDITHPDAATWLHELFATIARHWGYQMIKLDFMAWSILAAERYRDSTRSAAEVYRLGLSLMRAGAGEGCHILECGPGNITVGLIDSMRIEADINYGYRDAAWRQYFQDPSCSLAAAAKRYYFHGRTWINDVDHVCLDLLSTSQAQAAATAIALSGGNLISGDRLVDLEATKLEILEKVTPSFGVAAAPVDLLDADVPTTLALRVERSFGAWSVVGFFNPDPDSPVERRFPIRRLGLDSSVTYLAFDFWQQIFVGEVRGEIRVSVAPASVTLLALHAATGVPQLLSTSRHVTQGGVELEDVRWDDVAQTLSGISLGPRGSAHDVLAYVPIGRPWSWGERHVYWHDYGAYSLKLIDEHVIRVRVRFEDDERVAWKIDLRELFG